MLPVSRVVLGRTPASKVTCALFTVSASRRSLRWRFRLIAGAALAQDRPGLFGNIFNRGDDQGDQQAAPRTRGGGNDSAMRLDRIENSLRQLTGKIEQLQYQNQQLQTQVRELQSRAGIAPQAAPGAPVGSLMPQRPARRSQCPRACRSSRRRLRVRESGPTCSIRTRIPMRRARRACSAPKPPRQVQWLRSARRAAARPAPRSTCRPYRDRSRRACQPRAVQLPPPPQANPSATGARLATLPPSAKPQDEYDLAYGYVLHKDYGLATQAFRDFVRKYPEDKLIPDAQYWMGESLYQQQHYRDAAEVLPRRVDQVRAFRQGAGFASAPRPVARRAEEEGSGLRHARRGRPQISARLGQREALGRGGTEARPLLTPSTGFPLARE